MLCVRGCIFDTVCGCRALGGGGGVLYCAAPADCLFSGVTAWLAAVSVATPPHSNRALYGPLAATPPALLTAPVTSQCSSLLATPVLFNSSTAVLQSVSVPSGCPLAVAVRLIDQLNNTVVSFLADSVVLSSQSTGACAGGETTLLLSRGTATVTMTVAGDRGAAVTAVLSVRAQLTSASTGVVSLSSGPVEFIVTNCTAGTGRAGSVLKTVGNACSQFSQLVCSPCGFGTYSLVSNNDACNLLNSANAVSTANLVCALPGYWVLADNVTGLADVYPCAPGMCTGACVTQNGTDAVSASLYGLHCYSDAALDGQVTGYCSGAVGCSTGFGGFMCGACADGYALWHSSCVGVFA